MEKSHILPLDYKSISSSTIDFTDQEMGCYIRLLIKQWDSGSVSSDLGKLGRISDSVEKNKHILNKFIEINPGALQNKRMEEIRLEWEQDFVHKKAKKTINKKDQSNKIVLNLVLPFDTEEFVRVWTILRNQPKWRKKSIEALQGCLKKLSQFTETEAIQMMQQSIDGNYQGIFELRTSFKAQDYGNKNSRIGNSRSNQQTSESLDNRIENLFDKIEERNKPEHN